VVSDLCKNNDFKLNEMSMMQMQELLKQLELSYQLGAKPKKTKSDDNEKQEVW
jgi:hypothetical protein